MIALDLLLCPRPLVIGGQTVVEGPHAIIGTADDELYVVWWTGSTDPNHPDYERTIIRADMTMLVIP